MFKHLFNNILQLIHTISNLVLSGSEFNNVVMKELFKLTGIQQILSSPYHLQSNSEYIFYLFVYFTNENSKILVT